MHASWQQSRCLESLAKQPTSIPQVDVKIFVGAGLVHLLDSKKANVIIKTFDDYTENLFVPYLMKELFTTIKIDVVWDVYKSDSLKAYTDSNKTRLFSILANANGALFQI